MSDHVSRRIEALDGDQLSCGLDDRDRVTSGERSALGIIFHHAR
jgi:hypothetical protein